MIRNKSIHARQKPVPSNQIAKGDTFFSVSSVAFDDLRTSLSAKDMFCRITCVFVRELKKLGPHSDKIIVKENMGLYIKS